MPTTKEVYAMPGNEDLWQAATICHQVLADAGIAHSVLEASQFASMDIKEIPHGWT